MNICALVYRFSADLVQFEVLCIIFRFRCIW